MPEQWDTEMDYPSGKPMCALFFKFLYLDPYLIQETKKMIYQSLDQIASIL